MPSFVGGSTTTQLAYSFASSNLSLTFKIVKVFFPVPSLLILYFFKKRGDEGESSRSSEEKNTRP